MHRFFVPPEWMRGESVIINDELSHQIGRVLRLKAGDRIVILDNSGWEFEVKLIRLGLERVEGEVVGKRPATGEPRIQITLYQGMMKGAKFEFVLQKGTELGVTAFVPMLCERSVAMGRNKKEARWGRIIQEAAEQSRRGRLPILSPTVSFREACQKAQGFSLIPWEEESSRGLKAVLQSWLTGKTADQPLAINLLIGPEGGFSPGEIAYAKGLDILPVSLGKRILRAETAGLAAAAAILYEVGDLG
ncbi:MAG: 16S rRNA (uracil(1498)-N(3))-methyltransferase [Chloroflexi bacterium]|nr:16S rRNA (uracil(1498)-N(3))-methyltransferase [Chloroflexota bacterium]